MLAAGCAEPSTAKCPGQFNPQKLTNKQLTKHGIADIPIRPSTSQTNVRWVVDHRGDFIRKNYPDVVDVSVGDGWGVTYSNDQFGNTTYHHTPDHIVVATVAHKASCPDPVRGTLFLLDQDNDRTPVRFDFRN